MILVYTITVPKQSEWEAQRASHLIEQLLYGYNSLLFRIVARASYVEWQIIDLLEREPEGMRTAIQATYPEANIRIDTLVDCRQNDGVTHRLLIPYGYLVPEFVAPIKHVEGIKPSADPLAALTQTMTGLQPGEQIIYTVFVTGLLPDAYIEGTQRITRKVYDGSLLGFLFPQKVDRYVPEDQRVFVDKLQRALYQCSVMIQIDSPYPERLEVLLSIDNQTIHFDEASYNGIRWYGGNGQLEVAHVGDDETDLLTSALGTYLTLGLPSKQTKALQKQRRDTRLVLEPREIGALWHLPHREFQATTIAWTKTAQVELPQVFKGKRNGLCIGTNQYAGRSEPVYLPDEDRRTHCLVVGKAGVGKSNFLHQLIHQDIMRHNGVIVIDPHGTLVDQVLRTSIPEHRERDVVLLDLGNSDYPLPLNPMRGLHDDVGIGRILDVLYGLYPDLKDMPQTSDALENALLALQSDSEATLVGCQSVVP